MKMDSLLLTCPSNIAKSLTQSRSSLLGSSANGYCYFPSLSSSFLRPRRTRLIVAAAAAKKENSNKSSKVDKHSAVPKADESTGVFPEAVLLKEKKVQEDGKLLPEFADAEEQELFEALTLQLESDLDVERMRHYEVVYLIHEDHKDEVESVNEKVKEFVKEKKGRLWRFSDWGMRRLAYKIQKAKNAHYILMNFEMEARWINDFKTMLDNDERVIRHLVIKRDKAETEACPPPPEFQSLRAGTDDDNDEEDDYDDEEDYEDEDNGEDWEEGEEVVNEASYEEEADGIIYVDEEAEDGDGDDDDRVRGNKGRRTQKVQVAR